jgi:hypothetical protein
MQPKLIANFKDWIRPEWIEYLLTETGMRKPEACSGDSEFNQAQRKINNVYDTSRTFWHKFDSSNYPFPAPFPFNIDGVTFQEGKNCEWWFLKYLPGDLLPFHTDMYDSVDNMIKLWMPLQCYKQGHVMIYGDELVTNYKAGDLFMFNDIFTPHGACNMGYEPRLMLCMTMYNELGAAFRKQYAHWLAQ